MASLLKRFRDYWRYTCLGRYSLTHDQHNHTKAFDDDYLNCSSLINITTSGHDADDEEVKLLTQQ